MPAALHGIASAVRVGACGLARDPALDAVLLGGSPRGPAALDAAAGVKPPALPRFPWPFGAGRSPVSSCTKRIALRRALAVALQNFSDVSESCLARQARDAYEAVPQASISPWAYFLKIALAVSRARSMLSLPEKP